MNESPTKDLAGALGAGEDRLERYHTTYYSFLIPYTGASGAVVWTMVTNDVSPLINVAAGLFIIGLSLFYFIWLRSSYNRMAKTVSDTKRIYDSLMPDAPSNPYAADMHNPEQIFFWFVLVMGTSGAGVCVLNAFLSS